MSGRDNATFWARYDEVRELPDHVRLEEWVLHAAHIEDLAYTPIENGLWHSGLGLTKEAMSKYEQLSPPAQARLYAANPILMEHGKPIPQPLPQMRSFIHPRLVPVINWANVQACPPRSYARPSGTCAEMQEHAALAATPAEYELANS
jgi:hypothetical protein